MCGIGGIYVQRINNLPSFKNDLKKFILLTSRRGKDGTGIEIYNLINGNQRILKTDQKAEIFLQSEKYKKLLHNSLNTKDSFLILFHCRLHTHGSLLDALQPINKEEGSLIHNGIVANYKDLLKGKEKFHSDESDSQALLSYILLQGENINKVYKNINGSSTIAFLIKRNLL